MKPVLICSSDFDVTTNKVIDWLHYFGTPFLRFSENDKLELKSLFCSDKGVSLGLIVKGRILNINNIKSYWYRRGYLNLNWQDGSSGNKSIDQFCAEERSIVFEFIEQILEGKGIGSYKDNTINKLIALNSAAKCGLKTPTTFLSSYMEEYRKQSAKKPWITKALTNSDLKIRGHIYPLHTSLVELSELPKSKRYCVPFWTQEYVNKIADVRVFYWLGSCFAAFIYSQNHRETEIDMRTELPDGTNPIWERYQLPEELVKRIRNFMRLQNLKSGSLDFALTQENHHIFFEVNPVGQFGYLSRVCGYNIEKRIAYDLGKGRFN